MLTLLWGPVVIRVKLEIQLLRVLGYQARVLAPCSVEITKFARRAVVCLPSK